MFGSLKGKNTSRDTCYLSDPLFRTTKHLISHHKLQHRYYYFALCLLMRYQTDRVLSADPGHEAMTCNITIVMVPSVRESRLALYYVLFKRRFMQNKYL